MKEEADRKKREAEYFDYKTIHKYKETLGKYGEIFVNDAPLATLTNSNSIVEIKCPRKVMGVKMTEELRKVCHFFLRKHPSQIKDLWYQQPPVRQYHEKPFTAVIGGTISSVQDVLDRILLVNGLFDTCHEVHLGGQFALGALYALGGKLGFSELYETFDATAEFYRTLFLKAVEKRASLRFPVDVMAASNAEIDQAKAEQAEFDALVQQQAAMAQMQSKRPGGKSGGGQNTTSNTGGGNESARNQSISGHIPAKHWIDRLAYQGRVREVRFNVSQLWNEFVRQVAYPHLVETGKIGREDLPYNEHPLTKGALMTIEDLSVLHSRQITDNGELAGDTSQQFTNRNLHTANTADLNPHSDVILELGEDTRQLLFAAIPEAFKLLWDGSLSPYCGPIVEGSLEGQKTNKRFTERLLDLRVQSQNDEEPQVTLLHGPETQAVVRGSLLRIKVEQLEAQEEIKRHAREVKMAQRLANAEEDEEEEEEEQNVTLGDESVDESKGGINHELALIADFHVFDIPQFTSRVMQGVANKALLAMSRHTRKTPEQTAEDLYLLEEI
jgi:hypothetical protein